MNWNFMADARLAKELAWLFFDRGTFLKSYQENLDLKLRNSCRYAAICLSLATYSR